MLRWTVRNEGGDIMGRNELEYGVEKAWTVAAV